MRHNTKGTILDRKKGPREALLRSLATSVLLREKVKTTRAKAKAAAPLVEKAITIGKNGGVGARRALASMLYGENVARKVVEVVSPRYKARNGGYTRITALGRREGDGAEMVQIALI